MSSPLLLLEQQGLLAVSAASLMIGYGAYSQGAQNPSKKKKKKKNAGGVAQSKHMFAAQMIVMEHPSPEV